MYLVLNKFTNVLLYHLNRLNGVPNSACMQRNIWDKMLEEWTQVSQTRAREILNSRKTDCIKQKVIYYGSSHVVNNVNKYKKITQ